jgi:uncharacterized membrane protein
MRTLIASLVVTALVISTGCQDNSFHMKAPAPTSVKQGESKTIKMTFDRGKDFKQNVKLAVDTQVKGIKIELSRAELKAGDPAEVEVKLTAEEQATPGEAKVKVTATPEKGEAQTAEVKVTVEEAKKPEKTGS